MAVDVLAVYWWELMSFLFISHASTDKRSRVKPLVEAMIQEGEAVWIDRPGMGDQDFGFAQAYINRNDIDYLQSGRPWSSNISQALRQAGAVIGCLSRALLEDRAVLEGELTFAEVGDKLVTCIVDDISFEDLPRFQHGLIDFGKHYSPRIDCALLRQALDHPELAHGGPDKLPARLRAEWEKVRNLIAAANRIRREPKPLRSQDIERAAKILRDVPVGPILHVSRIPARILEAMADSLAAPDQIRAIIEQTNALVLAEFPAGYTDRQILLRLGQLPTPGTLPPDDLWTEIFRLAGLKARRTVVALLLTPMGAWALARTGTEEIAESLLSELRSPIP